MMSELDYITNMTDDELHKEIEKFSQFPDNKFAILVVAMYEWELQSRHEKKEST